MYFTCSPKLDNYVHCQSASKKEFCYSLSYSYYDANGLEQEDSLSVRYFTSSDHFVMSQIFTTMLT